MYSHFTIHCNPGNPGTFADFRAAKSLIIPFLHARLEKIQLETVYSKTTSFFTFSEIYP